MHDDNDCGGSSIGEANFYPLLLLAVVPLRIFVSFDSHTDMSTH